MHKKEQQFRDELSELHTKLQDQAIFSTKDYPRLAKRMSELEDAISLMDQINELKSQIGQAETMAQDADPDMASMAQDELAGLSSSCQPSALSSQPCSRLKILMISVMSLWKSERQLAVTSRHCSQVNSIVCMCAGQKLIVIN